MSASCPPDVSSLAQTSKAVDVRRALLHKVVSLSQHWLNQPTIHNLDRPRLQQLHDMSKDLAGVADISQGAMERVHQLTCMNCRRLHAYEGSCRGRILAHCPLLIGKAATPVEIHNVEAHDEIAAPSGLLIIADMVVELMGLVKDRSSIEQVRVAHSNLRLCTEACFQDQHEAMAKRGCQMDAGHMETHAGILKQIDLVGLRVVYGDTDDLLAQLQFLHRTLTIRLAELLLAPLNARPSVVAAKVPCNFRQARTS